MSSHTNMVRPDTSKLSVRKQCSLLSVNRNRLYYHPVAEPLENVNMMRLMDEHLLCHPTEGVWSMVYYLWDKGYPIGTKRIRRLFREWGKRLFMVVRTYKNGLTRVYPAIPAPGTEDSPCKPGLVY
jgi:putative transposase